MPLVILSTDESTTDTKARRYAYRRFCIATGRRWGERASVRLPLEDIGKISSRSIRTRRPTCPAGTANKNDAFCERYIENAEAFYGGVPTRGNA